jgi:hypothetical protein
MPVVARRIHVQGARDTLRIAAQVEVVEREGDGIAVDSIDPGLEQIWRIIAILSETQRESCNAKRHRCDRE